MLGSCSIVFEMAEKVTLATNGADGCAVVAMGINPGAVRIPSSSL